MSPSSSPRYRLWSQSVGFRSVVLGDDGVGWVVNCTVGWDDMRGALASGFYALKGLTKENGRHGGEGNKRPALITRSGLIP